MSSSNKSEYRVGIGASSVLMILVVLAMTALGLLSLGSARQTEAQTERNLQTTVAYYEAAARIQQKLLLIGEAAREYAAQEGAPDSWFDTHAIDGVQWTQSDATVGFMLSEPMDDEHVIAARGVLGGGARPTLTQHTLISTKPLGDDAGELELLGE